MRKWFATSRLLRLPDNSCTRNQYLYFMQICRQYGIYRQNVIRKLLSVAQWIYFAFRNGISWLKIFAQMNMSRDMTKPTKWLCAQQRLRSACASAQMPRLIWVFAGRIVTLLVFVMSRLIKLILSENVMHIVPVFCLRKTVFSENKSPFSCN